MKKKYWKWVFNLFILKGSDICAKDCVINKELNLYGEKIVQTAGRTQLGILPRFLPRPMMIFFLARCGTTPVWMSKRAALLR